MKNKYRNTALDGFSLVEITLALGLIAFCVITLVGLLPTGLNAQQQAQDEARAAVALNQISSAVRATRSLGVIAGNSNYAFPEYLSDSPTAPTNPTKYYVSQSKWNFSFGLLDDGTIKKTDNTTDTPRQTLYFEVQPPATESAPVRVYAAVAWPYKPTDNTATSPADLKGRQGYVDTVIYFTPKAN